MTQDIYDIIDSAIVPWNTALATLVSTMFDFWEDASEFICSEAMAGRNPTVKFICPVGEITSRAHWVVETTPVAK